MNYEDNEIYAKLLRALKNDELVVQDTSFSFSFIIEMLSLILISSLAIGSGSYYFSKVYLIKEDDKTLRKRFIDSHEEENES